MPTTRRNFGELVHRDFTMGGGIGFGPVAPSNRGDGLRVIAAGQAGFVAGDMLVVFIDATAAVFGGVNISLNPVGVGGATWTRLYKIINTTDNTKAPTQIEAWYAYATQIEVDWVNNGNQSIASGFVDSESSVVITQCFAVTGHDGTAPVFATFTETDVNNSFPFPAVGGVNRAGSMVFRQYATIDATDNPPAAVADTTIAGYYVGDGGYPIRGVHSIDNALVAASAPALSVPWSNASAQVAGATLVVRAPNNPPNAPGAVVLPASGQSVAGNAIVSWGAATDPDGTTPTYGVVLMWDNYAGSKTIRNPTAGTSFTYNFASEPARQDYQIIVRAYDPEAAFSAPTVGPVFTVNRAPGVPGAPSVSPDPVNTAGTITFAGATDPDGQPLTYDVEYSGNNGDSYARIKTAVQSGVTHDFTNTPATTLGRLRVRSVDSYGVASAWIVGPQFSVVHNVAPSPATNLSPNFTVGAALNRLVTNRFKYQFNDQAGDSPSKTDYRFKLAGTPTWTHTFTNLTPNAFHDLPGSYLPDGDYEWQVLPYDQLGVPATAWSASARVLMSTPGPGPVITTPSGNDIPQATSSGILAWSVADQQAYEWRMTADNGGVADTSVLIIPEEIVNIPTARNRAVPFPDNNVVRHLQIRTQGGNGLWTDWSSVRVPVAYTPPNQPLIALTPRDHDASVLLTFTFPSPVDTTPAVSHVDVYRAAFEVDDEAGALKVANDITGNTWVDRTVASGVDYSYRVEARGTNGTVILSEWFN